MLIVSRIGLFIYFLYFSLLLRMGPRASHLTVLYHWIAAQLRTVYFKSRFLILPDV